MKASYLLIPTFTVLNSNITRCPDAGFWEFEGAGMSLNLQFLSLLEDLKIYSGMLLDDVG